MMSHKNSSSSAASSVGSSAGNALSSSASRLSSLRVGIGALVLSAGAGLAVAEDAQAAEITTVTHDNAMLCFGSSAGGIYRGQQLSTKTVTESGKTTFAITSKMNGDADMFDGLSPEQYVTRAFRNYFYGYTEEGWLMYKINKDPLAGASLGPSPDLWNQYELGDDVSLVEGLSFDKDRLLIIGGKKIDLYAPFKPDGKVKQAYKLDNIEPEVSFTPKATILGAKVLGNKIYAMEKDGEKMQMTAYALENDKIVQGASAQMSGKENIWEQGRDAFVVIGESKTKFSTCLIVERPDIDGIMVMDTADLTKKKEFPGVTDIAHIDPEGRYQLRSMSSGKLIFTDGYTGATKEIMDNGTPLMLNGNTVHLSAHKNLTFQIIDPSAGKAFLFELANPITMDVKKLGSTDVAVFNKEYKYSVSTGTGGADCVPNPNLKGTSETTGTQPEAVEVVEAVENGVEKDIDAGTSDSDGGSLEVITDDTKDTQNPPDAADAQDAADIEPDTVSQPDTNGDGTPDQSIPPDQITRADTGKDVPTETSGNKPDAALSTDMANKPETAPTTNPKPPVNDGCNTTRQPSEDGLLATGLILAGVAYAVRRRREQFSMIRK